jgi:hypothetical protein
MRRKKAFGKILGCLFLGLYTKGRFAVVSINGHFTVCFSQYATTSNHQQLSLKVRS